MYESDLLAACDFQWPENKFVSSEELLGIANFLIHRGWSNESFAVLRVGPLLAILHSLVTFVFLFDCVEVRATAWCVISCWRHLVVASRLVDWHLQIVLVDSVEAVSKRSLDDRFASSSQACDERGSLTLSLSEERYLSGAYEALFEVGLISFTPLLPLGSGCHS